jgi:hypothetical protein
MARGESRATGPRLDLVWWSWLVTALALGARLGGLEAGLAAAVVATAATGLYLAWRARTARALGVQVRAAFAGLLLLGAWPPLVALHWAELAGTAVLLLLDYCFLARALSLMPWNRRGKMTVERLRVAFLSAPVPNVLTRRASGADARPDRYPGRIAMPLTPRRPVATHDQLLPRSSDR